MSIGSIQGCASTLPEIMQEDRLKQIRSSENNNLAASNPVQDSRLDTEPASIDTANLEEGSLKLQVSPVNSVSATEPISNSIIEATLANNKSMTNSYQLNGQQKPNSISSGLLIDITA